MWRPFILCGLILTAGGFAGVGDIPGAHSSEGRGPGIPLTLEAVDTTLSQGEKLHPQIESLRRRPSIVSPQSATVDAPLVLRGELVAGSLRIENGRVHVFVETPQDAAIVAALLEPLGMEIERVSVEHGLVQGWLAVDAIERAAATAGVRMIRPPDYGLMRTGSVTGQGYWTHQADIVGALGVTGQGVRVGVISDGLAGLSTAQSTGDLPATVNTASCNVVPHSPTAANAGSEGTAMMEIVHDLAPSAELWFGHWGARYNGTSLDFMDAVDCLAASVDVIIDDVGWYNGGPYDGSSAVSVNASTAITSPTNRLRMYTVAAGNDRNGHYQDLWTPSGFTLTDPGNPAEFWMLHGFRDTVATDVYPGPIGLLCPATTGYCADAMRVPAGGVFSVALQWDDAWGYSPNDYDVFVLDVATNTAYLVGANRQTGGSGIPPAESFGFANPHPTSSDFAILIGNYHGTAQSVEFDLFVHCPGCFNLAFSTGNSVHTFNTQGSSVANNSDASGVMAVGTINVLTNNVPALYSSFGPTEDARSKPEFIGVDGVAVSGAGGFPTVFQGTSAAVAGVGATAALILSCNPLMLPGEINDNTGADRAMLYSAMVASSEPVQGGPPGSTGFGVPGAARARIAAKCASPVRTLAGTGAAGFSGDNGLAQLATLQSPETLVVDANGAMYIADTFNCRVRKIVAGTITTIAGTGVCGYAGDDGPATAAKLYHPRGLALGPDGGLYISDHVNCRVRKVYQGTITLVAGNGIGAESANCEFGGDGGDARLAGIYGPYGLSFDQHGDLYIVSSGHCRVRKVSNGIISTVAGLPTVGNSCGYAGDGGAPSDARFDAPRDVMVDAAGDIYISDTYNCAIRKISGGIITTLSGGPPCPLGLPHLLRFGPDGALYVADAGWCRIARLAAGNWAQVAGSMASCSFTGDGGPPEQATFNSPRGFVFDAQGNLFIADSDNNRIRWIEALDSDSDGLSNVRENPHACISAFAYDAYTDADSDGLLNHEEILSVGTNPCLADSDTDGCTDGAERGQIPVAGGQRDPTNQWDFYDVNGTRKVDAADIGLVRTKFNGTGPTPPADVSYDRRFGAAVWAPGPPDNKINAVDIGLVRASFNHNCQPPP